MTATTAPPTRRALSRARLGVGLLFGANGAMWANVVPRLPEIRDQLDISYGGFGLAVAAAPIGAVVLGLGAGMAIRRLGSAPVAVLALIGQALAIWAAGAWGNVWLFAGFLFLNGAFDAHTDVAQNSHGLTVQRFLKRSIINSLHAMWSLGAAVGGFMGTQAAAAGLSIRAHLGIATVVFIAVALVAWWLALPRAVAHGQPDGSEDHPPVAPWRLPRPALLVLLAVGLVAIAGAEVEDVGFTWSSNYLADVLEAPTSVVGYGLVSLMLMHFIGRIIGDRLVDRFGERAVAAAGGAITAVGMSAALVWPSVTMAIIGFGLAGLGVATTVPAAFAAADDLPGLQPGTGITLVSWMLRLAFLFGPPIVGWIADQTSLSTGLWIVPLAGVVVIAMAPTLRGKAASAHPDST